MLTKKDKQTKKFILESKCNCTYECALLYSILANRKYQPKLIYEAIKK